MLDPKEIALRLWKEHGGGQHGPRVETLTIPLGRFDGFINAFVTGYLGAVGVSRLTTVDAVRAYLTRSPNASLAEIREATGIESKLLSNALGYLVRRSEVQKDGYGKYRVLNLRATTQPATALPVVEAAWRDRCDQLLTLLDVATSTGEPIDGEDAELVEHIRSSLASDPTTTVEALRLALSDFEALLEAVKKRAGNEGLDIAADSFLATAQANLHAASASLASGGSAYA